MNDYKKILSYWHKIEHLNPAFVKKNADPLTENEPWKINRQPKNPNKTFVYTVYLGVFDLDVAKNFVAQYFKSNEKDVEYVNKKNCFASLKLNEIGEYINDSMSLSTLPWALSLIEKGEVNNDDWVSRFEELKRKVKESLEKHLTLNSNELTTKVVDRSQLLGFQNELEAIFKWSDRSFKEIYVEHTEVFKFKEKKTNDNLGILNSFYTKDLEKIIVDLDKNKTSKAFEQYIEGCLNMQSERIDLSKKIDKIKNNLSPNNYPDGCWPSSYTLSLMQQFAVNNIFNNLSESNQAGMYSVNGPPGTGKTTLLRDIIAPIIVKRAKELILIKNPSEGFKKMGSFKNANKKFTYYIYSPVRSISNSGIVISSSNNGAVENISKELPLKAEVSEQYRSKISYFKDVAEGAMSLESWGLISAVLGRQSNIKTVASNLWSQKKEEGSQNYNLKTFLEDKKLNDNTEWKKIKEKFKEKLSEVSAEKEKLNTYKNESESFVEKKIALTELLPELEIAKQNYLNAKAEYKTQKTKVEEILKRKKENLDEIIIIKESKPSFLVYWFNRKLRKKYKKVSEVALNNLLENQELFKTESHFLSKKELSFKKLKQPYKEKEQKKRELIIKLERLEIKVNYAKKILNHNYADSSFWENIESQESQESCPWYSDELKKLQSELFIISLEVNEVFILTANSCSSMISTTLNGFFDYLKGNKRATKEQIKAMWDTFFLVIPVISSSFASIQTMFKDLGREDIPWLFIDEAGQAIPQAAAGSIWRSKRVCVVGDPFQIEPVLTTPNLFIDCMSQYFDLDDKQTSTSLSVQSMADRINNLGSFLTIKGGEEWIGIPLRVHRRCINPMFEISNRIAYNNTMYCSTIAPKTIGIKFETAFIHCKGNVKGKHFVQEQADRINEILKKEIALSEKLPDVFVITPFKLVSSELRKFLFKNLIIEIRKYKEISQQDMKNWVEQHVGTVHTFQGKQAEGVILCLGLDDTSIGAADWASKKPNILNVAITRAKYRFIAIGDENIWLKLPYFYQLSQLSKLSPKQG